MSHAQPAIFVYGLHDPAYGRVLRHLSREGRHLLVLADPPMVAAAVRDGLRHVAYEATAPPASRHGGRGAQRRAAELFRRRDLEAGLQSHFVHPDGGSFWPDIRDAFAAVLEAAIADGVDGAGMASHLLGAFDLRLVVGGFDMTAFARGLIGVLDQAGVPSLHVPHGIFGPTRGVVMPGTCSEIHATQVAAPGPFSRAIYAENGQPLDRVVVTGAPRFDLHPALRTRTPAAARERMRLDSTRPLVLYATTWVEWATAHSGRYSRSLAPIFAGFLDGVRAARHLRPQVVVKFHPAEVGADTGPDVIEGYRTLCRAAGVDDVRFVGGPLLPWIAAADVVVGINSTTALEAVLADRIAVNVPAHPSEALALYGPDTAVLAVPTPEALAEAIAPALADRALHAHLRGRAATTIARYTLAADAGAAARVATAALALMRPTATRTGSREPAPLVSLVVPGPPPCRAATLVEDDVPHEVLHVPPHASETMAAACAWAAAHARGRFLVIVDDRVPLGPGWLPSALSLVQATTGRAVQGGGSATRPGWVAVRRGEWPLAARARAHDAWEAA